MIMKNGYAHVNPYSRIGAIDCDALSIKKECANEEWISSYLFPALSFPSLSAIIQ
jgi:hypothetical protein